MVIVCGSLYWHHVDHSATLVNCTLTALHMLKLHQEYYYTYYFSLDLLLFQEVPYILALIVGLMHCLEVGCIDILCFQQDQEYSPNVRKGSKIKC